MSDGRSDGGTWMLRPCTDYYCVLAEPGREHGTHGGCSHLKTRGPENVHLIKTWAAKIRELETGQLANIANWRRSMDRRYALLGHIETVRALAEEWLNNPSDAGPDEWTVMGRCARDLLDLLPPAADQQDTSGGRLKRLEAVVHEARLVHEAAQAALKYLAPPGVSGWLSTTTKALGSTLAALDTNPSSPP